MQDLKRSSWGKLSVLSCRNDRSYCMVNLYVVRIHGAMLYWRTSMMLRKLHQFSTFVFSKKLSSKSAQSPGLLILTTVVYCTST